MKVLVTYASKYGSTAEIAEVIGKELIKREYEVEVKPISEVGSLAEYDGFVIGSAVYAGSWLKGATKFLRTHQEMLASRPVWLFSSGPTGEGDPNEIMSGWTFPENLASVREAIKPRDVILFHGYINLDKLNFGEKMVIKSVKATVGDYRDWLVIRTWASMINLEG
ncbi:MAG: flavodoxin domain-containing protein [Anaerolineae bacterium]|nr:flavodoxin domain-containing protein [Anaerolineae bacterium]